MKMNQKFTVLGLLVLGVVVAGLNAKAADVPAQFTLATETRWGQATLPTGDYSFTLDHDYPGSVVTVMRGTKTVARIQTPGMKYIQSGRSEIIMASGSVREVNLPTIGVSLHYPTHNGGHRAAPQEPQVAQIVPVTVGGAGLGAWPRNKESQSVRRIGSL